jgi:diguanylate cyclase (GGDEF)-like protein
VAALSHQEVTWGLDSPTRLPTTDDESNSDAWVLARRNEELEANNRQLLLEVQRLAVLALLDPLTGLGNRRNFDECVDAELRRAAREGEPLTLLICDVDRFKQCNDVHGHSTGDEVLVAIGRLLRRYCRRAGDLAFRYGGDEFALLWPGVSRHAARELSDQLAAAVRDLAIQCLDGTPVSVTISIGAVTVEDRQVLAHQHFVAAADRALYSAKRAGRDRVCFALEPC